MGGGITAAAGPKALFPGVLLPPKKTQDWGAGHSRASGAPAPPTPRPGYASPLGQESGGGRDWCQVGAVASGARARPSVHAVSPKGVSRHGLSPTGGAVRVGRRAGKCGSRRDAGRRQEVRGGKRRARRRGRRGERGKGSSRGARAAGGGRALVLLPKFLAGTPLLALPVGVTPGARRSAGGQSRRKEEEDAGRTGRVGDGRQRRAGAACSLAGASGRREGALLRGGPDRGPRAPGRGADCPALPSARGKPAPRLCAPGRPLLTQRAGEERKQCRERAAAGGWPHRGSRAARPAWARGRRRAGSRAAPPPPPPVQPG